MSILLLIKSGPIALFGFRFSIISLISLSSIVILLSFELVFSLKGGKRTCSSLTDEMTQNNH